MKKHPFRIKSLLKTVVLPSLTIFAVSFVFTLSLAVLLNSPGLFDTRSQATQTILKGKPLEVIDSHTLQTVTHTALTISVTLTTIFLILSYLSTHQPKPSHGKTS